MAIKADRDYELNYRGTFMAVDGYEQAIHEVAGVDEENGMFTFADVLTNDVKLADFNNDIVHPLIPETGLRNLNNAMWLVGRRIAKQYRRAANFNNIDFLSVGVKKYRDLNTTRHHKGAVIRELFNPTYPDLRFAVWSLVTGRQDSAALSMDLGLDIDRGVINLYYRMWLVGRLDPVTLLPEVRKVANADALGNIVDNYQWGVV